MTACAKKEAEVLNISELFRNHLQYQLLKENQPHTLSKEELKFQEQSLFYQEFLQAYGYHISDDSCIKSISSFETSQYQGVRIWIDFNEQPDAKYLHKEDYFFIYEKESNKLFQILYFNANASNPGMACGFEEHFEDITFDGKEDLLISLGDYGASRYYQAYIWTEEGFQYKESFTIGSYTIEEETKTIIGFNRLNAGTYSESYYHYEENEFIKYRYEEKEYKKGKDGEDIVCEEIKDFETGTYIYKRPYLRVEIQKLEKQGRRENFTGNIYEVRLYPSDISQEVIQSFQIVAEEKLDTCLEDFNGDGYDDLALCWKQEEETKNRHWDIFFWKECYFDTESYVKDLVYDWYFHFSYNVPFFSEELYLKRNVDDFGNTSEETLFYLKNGTEYIPVRSVFYFRDYENDKAQVIITSYLEEEPINLYNAVMKESELHLKEYEDKIQKIFWEKE